MGDALEVGIDVVSPQTGQQIRRIALPGDGRRMFVDWTRDAQRIALVASSAGLAADLTQLYVLDVASGQSLAITDGQTKVWSPNWSADGRTLYYVAHAGATLDLWEQPLASINAASGAARVLTAGVGMRNAALSRDGLRLAYSQGRKVANVWRVPFRSDKPATWADAEQLTSDQAFVECVDVNRAGTQLAVSSDRAGTIDLWSLPAAGGPMTQLTSDTSAEWCPTWSPDGSTLAFFAHRTGNREIWTMPAVGGEWRPVTDNPGPDLHPSWSHDGRTLAHLTQRHEGTGGWVSPLDGRPGHMVTESGTLAWSPIDSRLAYRQSDRMWIRDTNRGAPAQPLPTTANGPPRWTLDGRHLVYRSSENSIAIVAAEGAMTQRLLADLSGRRGSLGDHGTPTDGRFVYFTWNEDLSDIWVIVVVSSPRSSR
jgi:Tol biopolymer transport system component